MKRLSVPLIALGVLGITACQQTVLTSSTPTTSVIDRANEMQNLLNFDSCLSNGLEQDAQAAASDERGQYLASAKTLSSCDSKLRDSASLVATERRMQAKALTVQNFIKGGDIQAARLALTEFETSFNSADLIYADGSSFKDTMRALLYRFDDRVSYKLASLNARRKVKDEVRRAWYWQSN
jgi:hypothetical protein